ncbi:Ankyrin repeat and IBR domain-containing protein 1 [Armadillidium vulgare]|nr:Ankyrin repeat and IBR domain-containing protein 1 [Armadillidium vulgare]
MFMDITLQDNGYNKTIFEYMQNELEEIVEKLSGMVARDYLVTPRGEIIATTYLVRKRRHKFVRAVSRGLLPPETPPALRKGRRKRIPTLMGMDPVDELESLEVMGRNLDPSQPWVKDNSGRHANLAALLDWPDFDSDDEESSLNQALTLTLLGKCSRKACPRPRARNPRTGTIHDFCSLRCAQQAKSYSSNNMNEICVSVWEGCDSNMELLIALEMSRLQMIEDEARRRQSWLQERSREHQREEQQFWSQTLPHKLHRSRNHMGASACNLMGSVDDTREEYRENAYASCESGSSGISNPNDISGHHCQNLSSSIPQESHGHSSQQLSSAEIAVDYFLKKLANNEISLRNLNVDSEADHKTEKDLLCFPKKPPRTEDGRFEYGELHENSYLLSFLPLTDMQEFRRDFRRSLSLGDLTDHSSDLEMRLDSDHAHQDYPEASSKLHLTNPLSNQRDSLDVESGSGEGELEWTDQGISSEVMGELDSPLTDLEVKGILSHLDASSQTETPFQLVVDEGTDRDESNSTEKSISSQITAKASSLQIHISHPNQLETQSSNEFESETGIPNSPTLYISGVSISRSPEPRSPKLLNSKETRSPTLNVPHCRTPEPRCCSNRLQTSPLPLYTRSRSSSLIVPSSATTPAHFDPCLGAYSRSHVIANDTNVSKCIHLSSLSLQATRASSPFLMNELRVSRSASEPEKGRLVFQFPKSPTEGALSSVLHVEESTLSSDDFHEALFLSKSPKSSKRKKSKRERNRDKDGREKSIKTEDKKDQLKVSKEWKEKHKESYKRKGLDNSTVV